MILVEDYLAEVKAGRIPPLPPYGTLPGPAWDYEPLDNAPPQWWEETDGFIELLKGMEEYARKDGHFDRIVYRLAYDRARRTCLAHGMWALVDQRWTEALARWIGNRTCLEIMAGAGWLARALADQRVDILATDNHCDPGNFNHLGTSLFPVENQEASEAVRIHGDRDIVICSWPVYENRDLFAACRAWGPSKPVIYIGETGGCCVPSDFWKNFRKWPDVPEIPLHCWPGLHDQVVIGCYGREEGKEEGQGV